MSKRYNIIDKDYNILEGVSLQEVYKLDSVCEILFDLNVFGIKSGLLLLHSSKLAYIKKKLEELKNINNTLYLVFMRPMGDEPLVNGVNMSTGCVDIDKLTVEMVLDLVVYERMCDYISRVHTFNRYDNDIILDVMHGDKVTSIEKLFRIKQEWGKASKFIIVNKEGNVRYYDKLDDVDLCGCTIYVYILQLGMYQKLNYTDYCNLTDLEIIAVRYCRYSDKNSIGTTILETNEYEGCGVEHIILVANTSLILYQFNRIIENNSDKDSLSKEYIQESYDGIRLEVLGSNLGFDLDMTFHMLGLDDKSDLFTGSDYSLLDIICRIIILNSLY